MRRALALCVALAGSSAFAQYLSFKMLGTQSQPFTVYVDSRLSTPAGLDYTIVQNATERAWATWSAPSCSSVKVRSLGPSVGTVPNPVLANDNYSVGPVWMMTLDADAREIFGPTTYVVGITLPRAYAGVLQTCDIYFNGFGAQWSVDGVPPSDRNDVETVVLHEQGHCLGLGHFGPAADGVMDQVVEVGQALRSLSPTDVQVLCARYPANGAAGAPCRGDGGCDTSLKCLAQPPTNGFTTSLCVNGCTTGANAACEIPLSCQASSAFTSTGFNGACTMPGDIITKVGKPCTQFAECGSGFGVCRPPEASSGTEPLWADGYCTQRCETGDPTCPAGSTCVTLDTGRYCTQSCRVGLADCRPQYACAPIDAIGTSGVCIPRCYNDADCADPIGTTCRTCDGLCVNRQNISGQIGDVCSDQSTCGAGQICRATDPNSLQKQCTQQCARGCAECPNGSTCTPGTNGELFCLRDCTGPGTCPIGLRCADTTVGKSCQPACSIDPDCPVGQFCYLGECYSVPPQDAGCATLCSKPDAGKPVVVPPKDGGVGDGGSGGCGCSSVDPLLLAALGALVVGRRRSRRPS